MNRRSFLLGALAAPVVIRTPGLLMPVREVIRPPTGPITVGFNGFLGDGWLVDANGHSKAEVYAAIKQTLSYCKVDPRNRPEITIKWG